MRYFTLIFLFALASCNQPERVSSPSSGADSTGTRVIKAYPDALGRPYFTSLKSDHFLIDAEVKGVTFRGGRQDLRVALDSITLKVFEQGTLLYRLTSPAASFTPHLGMVEFSGSTNLVLSQQEELDVHDLKWGKNLNKLGGYGFYSEGFVQLMKDESLIEGRGFGGTADLEQFYLGSLNSVIDLARVPE